MVDGTGNVVPSAAQAAFPLLVQQSCRRAARYRRGGLLAALMSSLAGVFNACVDALHDRLLSEVPPRRVAGATGVDRPRRDDGDGAHRAGLDPGDSGRARTLRVSAGHAGVSRAADRRGILLRRVHEAAERRRLSGGAACRASRWASFRLVVDTPVTLGMAGYRTVIRHGSWLWIVNNIYFQYYSLLIFVVSCVVLIGVSYATASHRASARSPGSPTPRSLLTNAGSPAEAGISGM